jgi:hypothetical protein
MKNVKNKIVLLAALLSAFIMACEPEGKDVIAGLGNNFVRVPQAANDINIVGVDLKPGDVSTNLLEIIRDVNSNDELQKTATINLKVDEKLIADYNTANGTNFIAMPTSLFKLSETSVQMASGDFSKNVKITFDPTKLTVGKNYAVGVSLVDAGGYKIRNGLGSALFQIIAKNKFHGRYKAIGVFTHPTAGPRAINRLKEGITVNPNTISVELGDLGGAGYEMLLSVADDNSVTIEKLGVTPNINQSYSKNYYDPATKSFHLHYSYNVAAPRIVQEVLTLQ